MTRIQLLVGDDGTRRTLASLLDQRYTVVTTQALQDPDCVVVDDRALPDHRDALLEHKRDADPVFVPVVLIRSEDGGVDAALPAPDSDDVTLVDDVVSAPIDRDVLFRRLSNLLARREQSRSLARRYRQSEADFRGLFRAIPDPAFVVGDDDTVTEANEEFCAITAESRNAVLGADPRSLSVFASADADPLDALDGAPDQVRFAFRDATGAERHAELRHREHSVDGTTRTIVVMHDVTDLAETNQQLEDFASIVSHDLRNPLSVAAARLPIVRDRVPEDADVADHLDVIEDSLRRMDDLIDGVRTLVRETGVETTRPVAVDDAARDAWGNVATADATLTTVADTTVVADRHRLLQLFENLFRNAVEHADDAPTVEVGATDDGFYVADDGPGIPEPDRERVFDAGYTTTSDGTGLGLKIVHEIATAHDWQITVTESDPGGTRFDVTAVDTPTATPAFSDARD